MGINSFLFLAFAKGDGPQPRASYHKSEKFKYDVIIFPQPLKVH